MVCVGTAGSSSLAVPRKVVLALLLVPSSSYCCLKCLDVVGLLSFALEAAGTVASRAPQPSCERACCWLVLCSAAAPIPTVGHPKPTMPH